MMSSVVVIVDADDDETNLGRVTLSTIVIAEGELTAKSVSNNTETEQEPEDDDALPLMISSGSDS